MVEKVSVLAAIRVTEDNGRTAPGPQAGDKESASNRRDRLCVDGKVPAKIPGTLKKMIADEVRSIFYASSRKKALEFFEEFKGGWEEEIPSAVKCLENSLDACLTTCNFQRRNGSVFSR